MREQSAPLVEGEDFYMEGAALVFTARYHLRRGYCCGNNCRHCPYDSESSFVVRCEEKRVEESGVE